MTCRHGMPGPSSCMDCQYEGDMPPAPRHTRSTGDPFPAHWPGMCLGCQLPISEGQMIVALTWDPDDKPPEYRHEGCT